MYDNSPLSAFVFMTLSSSSIDNTIINDALGVAIQIALTHWP